MGVVLSVAVSGVAGYVLLLALNGGDPRRSSRAASQRRARQRHPCRDRHHAQLAEPRQRHVGARIDGDVVLRIGGNNFSLAGYAEPLARDEGTPAAAVLRRVSATHGAPAPAIWTIVLAGFAAMIWSGAVPIRL